MEVANPAAAPAPAPAGGDWRSQLRPGAREVMVKQIMKSLKKHIPMTDQAGLNRLQNLADGFEQKFYTEATSQSSYSRKIAMLLLYVEPPNENRHHPAPGVPPQGNNPAQSSAVPLMSRKKIRQGSTSAYVQAPSLPSPVQRLTNIGQTSALQNMSGKSTTPQIQLMAMQSATQSVLQQNPLNTAQELELLLLQLFQQSPEWVLGQQRHLQLSMHQQPSLQQTQPTQQPNSPLQQQLIGQQPNLHKNQIKCQQGAAELQQQQRLAVQSNNHTWLPGSCLASATLAAWEDMADGATNLKKRKLDCSSSRASMPIFSAPVDDHCSAPVPSFPEIPEGGPQYTTLGDLQQFQG